MIVDLYLVINILNSCFFFFLIHIIDASSQKLKIVLFYNQYQEIYRNWSDDGFIDYSQEGIHSLTDFGDDDKG